MILDGRLYSGATDLAGEVGHVRLAEDGPVGYDKRGSFEGFCSGGGIVRLAQEHGLNARDARQVFDAADKGDPVALKVIDICGWQLGRGLAVIVDILNPELIVIGSIFARQRKHLADCGKIDGRARRWQAPWTFAELLPPGLGEQIGDFAALSIATLA